MCLGIPMTVVEAGETSAVCEGRGRREAVSTALVGAVRAGDWLLVHLGNAFRLLDEVEARQIDRALDGLEAAMRGDGFDDMFADLVDREPQLPDHLKAG